MLRLLVESSILMVTAAVATLATFWLHPNVPSLYIQMEPLREDERTLEQIENQWGGNVQWVDARISEKFEAEHIPGAISVNEQNFNDVVHHLLTDYTLLEELLNEQKPVVIYCEKLTCQASRKIADKLRTNLPALEIYVLHGGWYAWKKAKGIPSP